MDRRDESLSQGEERKNLKEAGVCGAESFVGRSGAMVDMRKQSGADISDLTQRRTHRGREASLSSHLEEKRFTESVKRSLFTAARHGAARAKDVRHGPACVLEDKPGPGCVGAGRYEVVSYVGDCAIQFLDLALDVGESLGEFALYVGDSTIRFLELVHDHGLQLLQLIVWNARGLLRSRSTDVGPNSRLRRAVREDVARRKASVLDSCGPTNAAWRTSSRHAK